MLVDGARGGVASLGDECSIKRGIIRGDGESPLSTLFSEIITEGAVRANAGRLFQYLTTLIKNAAIALSLDYLARVSSLPG